MIDNIPLKMFQRTEISRGSLKPHDAVHGAERGLKADLHGAEFRHCYKLRGCTFSDTHIPTTKLMPAMSKQSVNKYSNVLIFSNCRYHIFF